MKKKKIVKDQRQGSALKLRVGTQRVGETCRIKGAGYMFFKVKEHFILPCRKKECDGKIVCSWRECFLQFQCKARLYCNLSETAGTLSSGAGRDRLWTCLWIIVNPAPARDCTVAPHVFICTLHTAQHMLNRCTLMDHNSSCVQGYWFCVWSDKVVEHAYWICIKHASLLISPARLITDGHSHK